MDAEPSFGFDRELEVFSIPLQMMLVAVAGWVNREQLAVIGYFKEENRVLCEHLELRSDLRSKGPN